MHVAFLSCFYISALKERGILFTFVYLSVGMCVTVSYKFLTHFSQQQLIADT